MYSDSWLTKLDRALDSPKALAALLATIAVVYILTYLGYPVLPGNSPYPEGWWGWWDQSQYLKCTAGLANGIINKDTYFYPLGYSLIAAPFYVWTRMHAFFLPNFLFVIGSTAAFYRIARRLITSTEVFLLIIVFVIFYRGMLRDSLVVPWNTIPTHFLAYMIFYLTAFKKPNLREVCAASICLALIYVFKLPEFLCLLPCVLIAILSLRDIHRVVRASCVAAASVAVCIAAMLSINWAVFGSLRTPYEAIQQDIGVAGYPLFWKVYLLFVSGGPVFREGDQVLLSHFPWLLLTLPGLVYLLQRHGSQALGLMLSIAFIFGIYLSYNDLWPGNLYRYFLIHYLTWTFPLLALITYVGFKRAWKTKLGRWSFCSIPLLVMLLCFVTLRDKTLGSFPPTNDRLITIPVEAGRRINWVILHGAKSAPAKIAMLDRKLHTPGEYQRGSRTEGVPILLSNGATASSLEITPQNPGEVYKIEVGELVWTFRWSPQWLLYQWTRRFVRARVSILGKVAGVDLAGPLGVPDGAADEVVYVELPNWVMAQITNWRIELSDNRGHWNSAPDIAGAWLIKSDAPSDIQPANGNRTIRLCFPDNGDFDTAPVISIRGADSRGQLVIESVTARR